MALEIGSRLGHYDVTALIGEGGMGEVYRCTRQCESYSTDWRFKMTRVLAVALVIAASVSGAANDGDTRGFLIFGSAEALPFEALEADCPMGWEPTVEELFQATLTPAERERLLRPENAAEYGQRWKNDFITGPGGENVCNNPKSFLDDPRHPPFRGVQSKVAYGLNLDGTADGHATPNSCAHQKFEGPISYPQR